MYEKPFKNRSARERHDSLRDAHQSMVRERKAGFVADGMNPDKAERLAKDMQLPVTNKTEENLSK